MALEVEEEGAVVPPADINISTETTAVQVQDASSNIGEINVAQRDVYVYKNYYGYDGTKIDIVSALRAIPNLRKIHLDVLSKATRGTGFWFLKSAWFLLWLDLKGDLRILWGTGIPGAGKSVLTAIVIQDLEARAVAAGGNICVAYVYFRYSESIDLTVEGILAILVRQTVERHADCAALVNEVYARHLLEETEPTEAELLQLLGRFTELKEITFYVLEALDEAPEAIQLDVVQKLSTLNVRLLITSRTLKAQLPAARNFFIATQDADLDLHIAQKLGCNPHLRRLLSSSRNTSLKDEIVSSIKQKCGGMFLHASLQLDALSHCINAYAVRETLECFPSRVEDVYIQTWDRIQKQVPAHAPLAQAVLVWILNAPRSMKLEELEYAVPTCPDTYKFNPDRVTPGETLITLCQGLITLEEESRLVRLVHYTAKEPLQRLLHPLYPRPHSHLATVCITHLVLRGFQNTTIASLEEFRESLEDDPLLAYASETWAAHAREVVGIEGAENRIVDFVLHCSAFPAIIAILNGRAIFDILSPSHILALYNFPPTLFEYELIRDFLPTKVRRLSPLMIACLRGHYRLVQGLLRLNQTSASAFNEQGWSALIYTSAFGHETIIPLLLGHPEIMVNLVSYPGVSALMAAAANGHKGAVTLLLNFPGIEVNVVDHIGMSALTYASANGWRGIVTLLLATPDIMINLAANDGRTALFWAAVNGREGVVSLLLVHPGIMVNLVATNGDSALMAAAANGHQGIVALLLKFPGIEVLIVSNVGNSALVFAAANGYEGVVMLLLAYPGIQVNRARHDGVSALMAAATNGHQGTVAVLLAHPEIQVNQRRNDGVSALMLATDFGHEGIVRMFLKVPEIDISIQSTEGSYTALSVASIHGNRGIVELFRQFESRKRAVGRLVDNGFDRRQLVASRVGVRGHVGSRVPLSPLGTPFGIGTIETAESSTSDLDSDSEPSV